tara:strand:+ start:824 stop:1096 length:273 start_codon:yes stop_codon:yes gene_type:complete
MGRYDDKPLNKPFKSPIKTKKYTIIILDKNKKRKVIHFGDSTRGQFRDKIGLYSSMDNNDEKRKAAFYSRFGGKSTDKMSPLYYSQKYLW